MAFVDHTFDFNIRDINKNIELTNKAMLGFLEDIGSYHSDIARLWFK